MFKDLGKLPRHLLIFVRRGIRLVKRYGFWGAGRLTLRKIADISKNRGADAVERVFDRDLGVDTAGIVPLQAMSFDAPNKDFGARYQAINPDVFREMLDALPVDATGYTFVDFGSGKGRALLLATEYPFSRIVGVEFAPDLHDVAVRNTFSFAGGAHSDRLECVCMDAAEYELPAGPLVLFFYNPFEAHVWRNVLGNVRRSLSQDPRDAYLVFAGNSEIIPIIQSAGFVAVSGGGSIERLEASRSLGHRSVFAWKSLDQASSSRESVKG